MPDNNRGDVDDLKNALQVILQGPRFLASLGTIIAQKQSGIEIPERPIVYTYERLTKSSFPMCELLAYRGRYKVDTMVKDVDYSIGIRWSIIDATEEIATRSVELLIAATVDVLWDDSGTHSGLFADFNIGAGPVRVIEEDYAPMIPTPDHAFLKSATLVISVNTWRE